MYIYIHTVTTGYNEVSYVLAYIGMVVDNGLVMLDLDDGASLVACNNGDIFLIEVAC